MTSSYVADALSYIETNPDAHESRLLAALIVELDVPPPECVMCETYRIEVEELTLENARLRGAVKAVIRQRDQFEKRVRESDGIRMTGES